MTRSALRPSPHRRPRWQVALAAASAATLLAACGGGDDEASGSGGGGGGGGNGELQEVTFLNILPLESLTFTPELVASSCGYFEEQGLDVTFETTQGSSQAIQTVLAGGALITRVGDMETMLAIGERDAPLVNVGQVNKTGTIRFVSAESDPLESPEDIEGRVMGTPSEGGTSEIILKLVAATAGIPQEEVQTQVVGLAPGVFDLVTSGRIGGYVVSLDTAVALEQQQPEAVVYAPSDDVQSGGQVYVTSQEQADDPAAQEQLRSYLAAIKASIQFVAEDEANGFAETIECLSDYAIPTLEDPEVGKAALTQYVESWTSAGDDQIVRTVPEQWETVYEEMYSSGFVPDDLDPTEWYTNDFAPGS
ncbi:ABC transporter substrate-binding protein [Geodermatophilus sabuli]|uniref:NitT/TauT family transport system substrate-binding protein n=1 Tax=Geodermatophilus sabuli TaxID=1564158 RepID=A0A285EME0_9ACTN|nr:ABC transporter substrate-binding protein [Geodermatophilus sabuli]MBB3083720.1 NitT/TauT family transport system substrate-binding protein [Geodermatophilus sabuli]SNX99151.1 NitT/TauT family transport system substrate-binding protein [Geodermatophilus sabuli]